MNDNRDELKGIAEFIAGVGVDIPWHISRFHPTYKYTDQAATSLDVMDMAYDLGKEAGLRYVYMGNIPAGDKENTHCYNCNELLIRRYGFIVESDKIGVDAKCPKCSTKIDGIF
jgi:pyruvate formate lyase activating enzyme